MPKDTELREAKARTLRWRAPFESASTADSIAAARLRRRARQSLRSLRWSRRPRTTRRRCC